VAVRPKETLVQVVVVVEPVMMYLNVIQALVVAQVALLKY
jgi:hypothetical protein